MKRLLFVMNNLKVGGAEKALVSLLQQIDYTKYSVDLYLFSHEGMFMKLLPKEVNLLPEPKFYQYFDMPLKTAVIANLKIGRIDVVLYRILAGILFKTDKNPARREQRMWKYLKNVIPSLPGKYDAAIGYLEKMPDYFCIDKVSASKKIGFIHNDYRLLGMDAGLDRPYLKQFDRIFTVSESCKSILDEVFPDLKQRIDVMYNIVSKDAIMKLAVQKVDIPTGLPLIVSVGRLARQKGYEIAIEACRILKNNGMPVRWMVLGEGEERTKLERMIAENGLQDNFILNGICENPYPFVKAAAVYVQTSRFEGKSIAIDEAKMLGKPIVVTNFDTAKDQITDGYNGMIAEMNGRSVADAIMEIIGDHELRNRLMTNLANETGNPEELRKLLAFIE